MPQEIRELAKEVDAALQRRDLLFFKESAVTLPITCGAKDVPPGIGGPDCQYVGQQFDGFPIARMGSEGGTIPLENALALIERLWSESVPQATDQFGSGEARVYALGPSAVVLTALIERPQDFAGAGPLRVSLATHWRQESSGWRFVKLTSAFVLGKAFLVPEPAALSHLQGWERF
ncbi:MAG: hypothetical protein HYU86_10915 [Chloroflexi bacterium]|nr:hypothetical protein [Chloroflexota bacterium]